MIPHVLHANKQIFILLRLSYKCHVLSLKRECVCVCLHIYVYMYIYIYIEREREREREIELTNQGQ